MKKINDAFTKITPDCFEAIQEQLTERKENIIVETKQKKQNYWIYALPVFTLICLVVAVLSQSTPKIIATVGLDVNPSIELSIDQNNIIQTVTAHNEDAQKIIGNMDFKGSQLEVGVNALIGAMLKEGYIDELKNSLLISVAGQNQEENEKLRRELSLNIDELLKANHINGSIVSQTIDSKNDIQKQAEQYQISLGKARIIYQLIEKNNLYTFESLKDLTVNELNILLNSNGVSHVNVTGEANVSSYIGEEKAKNIAVKDANVSSPKIQKIELDYDDGVMIYEVEFMKDGVEYDYEINANNGNIVKKEIEGKKVSANSSQHSSTQNPISASKAKSIAMNHAGVSSISHYKIKEDNDDGQKEFELEFMSGQYKYEYTIRASDGKILDVEKKKVGNVKLSEDAAKQKAFEHARISSQNARDIEVELENNYYDVSFEANGYEYDYHIDATSGSILHYEKEYDD